MRLMFLAGVALIAISGFSFADGVAYRLPPDGTWVKYRITATKYEAWNLRPDEKEGWVFKKEPELTAEELATASRDNFLLVRSVGRQDVGGEPCRWVELVLNSQEEGEAKPEARGLLLKVLIPEKAFDLGIDPFEHVKKMYLSDRREDGEHFLSEVEDGDRKRYEVERFRLYFPVPPKGAQRKKDVELKTPLGPFKGYELGFEYGYEGKLVGGKAGWNYVKGHYQVTVSDRAPFGIVAVRGKDVVAIEEYGDGIGARLKQSWTMDAAETGTGAKSGLPDKN
ncbi:hypothetical protein V5E97_24690 [Singulisphaera sp. Ch08]|uniref:DUF3108 domain-containing protein n=1 Tax=Singulisphaera sp. Ch08 TaxID=3120278 RepID=A0AAU7C937_9BACT